MKKILQGKRIILTGCGYRPVKKVFQDIEGYSYHNPIIIDGTEMKLNIGAATTKVLAQNGATVHMVSTSKEKLQNLKTTWSNELPENLIEYSVVNLQDKNQTQDFIQTLPKDFPLYLVQSVGLGASTYTIKDENPYHYLQDTDISSIEQEIMVPFRCTHNIIKALLPIFEQQQESQLLHP